MGSENVDIGFFCCADIYWTAIVHVQRGRVCLGNVTDKDIISRLFSIPVNGDWLSGQESLDKDGDNAGFSVWILARPVNVGIPKRHIR